MRTSYRVGDGHISNEDTNGARRRTNKMQIIMTGCESVDISFCTDSLPSCLQVKVFFYSPINHHHRRTESSGVGVRLGVMDMRLRV